MGGHQNTLPQYPVSAPGGLDHPLSDRFQTLVSNPPQLPLGGSLPTGVSRQVQPPMPPQPLGGSLPIGVSRQEQPPLSLSAASHTHASQQSQQQPHAQQPQQQPFTSLLGKRVRECLESLAESPTTGVELTPPESDSMQGIEEEDLPEVAKMDIQDLLQELSCGEFVEEPVATKPRVEEGREELEEAMVGIERPGHGVEVRVPDWGGATQAAAPGGHLPSSTVGVAAETCAPPPAQSRSVLQDQEKLLVRDRSVKLDVVHALFRYGDGCSSLAGMCADVCNVYLTL